MIAGRFGYAPIRGFGMLTLEILENHFRVLDVLGSPLALRKDDPMKRTNWMAIAILILFTMPAAAQSLGDYARNARKNKPQPSTNTRYFDNDNLPTKDQLSVVGPDATNAPAAQATAKGGPDSS